MEAAGGVVNREPQRSVWLGASEIFFSWVLQAFFATNRRCDTVDGRNPAPVDMVNIPLFTGSYTSQVVSRISSINSITLKLSNCT